MGRNLNHPIVLVKVAEKYEHIASSRIPFGLFKRMGLCKNLYAA